MMAARIAAGASDRGLSSVTMTTSAAGGGDLAHERALLAVAVPAAAEHHDDPPRRAVPRGGRDRPRHRVRGVRVVDEPSTPRSPRRPAPSGPGRPGWPPIAGRRGFAVRPRLDRGARCAASALATLNRPGSGDSGRDRRPSGPCTVNVLVPASAVHDVRRASSRASAAPRSA